MKKALSSVLGVCLGVSSISAQQLSKPVTREIRILADKPVAEIQPTMWGVFFEDINMGADGGIYAELVKNRSFEFFKPMMGWSVLGNPMTEGDLEVINRGQEDAANPRFLRVALHHNSKGSLGLANEGFRGMGIKQGLTYHFSVMIRNVSPGIVLHVGLVDEQGADIGGASMSLSGQDSQWVKQGLDFAATKTVEKGSLRIWFEGDGRMDMDMISLFPDDTWKGRPGGMRADMVKMLADMKPGFLRFPGGCIVEGFDLAHRYQWKKTLGPVEDRQLIINRWNFEFAHRPTPDYFQTFGLGFYEYFQLAEDIGAEPLPILNCGMACQYNSAELTPMNQLDPYVQDALDLVEFANGDTTSRWGRVRKEMGHPAPFHLKMMGIGNENWGPQYIERLKVFTAAIKAKYPEIKLVNSGGTDPDGGRFDYLDKELRGMNADIIDEHYYRRAEWFFQHADRYDNYDRKGPKVFAGEYAAQSEQTVSPQNKNDWQTALSEAAFMTGLERNADVVCMASYAPLFAHAEGWQWTPDLIWVDNLRTLGTPNYYVQQLFSLNKGTRVVPALMGNAVVKGQEGLYATAAIDDKRHELILKLVNSKGKQQDVQVLVAGMPLGGGKGKVTVLKSAAGTDTNSFAEPGVIRPEEGEINCGKGKVNLVLAPLSLTILRMPLAGKKG